MLIKFWAFMTLFLPAHAHKRLLTFIETSFRNYEIVFTCSYHVYKRLLIFIETSCIM